MKKRNFLSFMQMACFMLISLLLQNCGGLHDLPIGEEGTPAETIEVEEQGRRKRPRIEIHQEEEQRLIEQRQEINSFDIFPPETWQHIFSHLDFRGVLSARAVNSDWNQLITGFREAGVVGLENKPQHIIDARSWVKRKGIDFKYSKLKDDLTPATIPSFAFYRLMGFVRNLPQSFWPYLSGTKVDTVDLSGNQIGDLGTIEFAKHLQGTQVHTIDLGDNSISDQGVKRFAKHLQGTRVHTVYLSVNEIGDQSAKGFAKYLQGTQVHTIDLSNNEISDQGAEGFAKYLQGTQVHTIYLGDNEIELDVQILLVELYPHIKWIF